MIKGVSQRFHAVIQLGNITRKFLSQSEWGGIHQVSSTYFHNVSEIPGFRIQRISQHLYAGQGNFNDLLINGDVHSRREGVIRGL